MSNRNNNRIVLEMNNEKPETCTASIERQYKQKGNQLDQVYGAIKEPSNNDQMKTAMQELHEWAVDKRNNQGILISLHEVVNKIDEMLQKEKEQMKDAFIKGSLSWASGFGAEKYYNETYNPDQV